MVKPSYQLELRRRQADSTQRRNTQERDDVSRTVGGLGGVVISPEYALVEAKVRDNTLVLLAGNHGGALIKKPNTLIIGQPGAVVNRLWEIDTDGEVTRIQSVHFRCLDPKADNAAALINIAANCTVIFTNCTFELEGVDMVAMANFVATAKGSFNGCTFTPTQTTGAPIVNPGIITNVYVIGCSNMTGRVHNLVTIIGETGV